jgi:hypothetical protein
METPHLLLQLFVWTVLAFFAVAILCLVVLSIYVRDVSFIKEHPGLFALELFAFAFVSSAPTWLLLKTRGNGLVMTIIEYFALAFKFATAHVLLQLSGILSFYFRK